MAKNSKIEWTDHTANFWWGCIKVSNGPEGLCTNCYASDQSYRYGHDFEKDRRPIKSVWTDLPKWNKAAELAGKPAKVFVMSMGDFLEILPDDHADKAFMDEVRPRACELMESLPHLRILMLTKRITNARKVLPAHWFEKWPANIRLGISVGTQKEADRDIPRLLELPCPNFLSMEPLIEQVDLGGELYEWSGEDRRDGQTRRRIDWVITGGESGPNARPAHPDWFRSLRDQCARADVPFHFKQWGEWASGHDLPAEEKERIFSLRGHVFHNEDGSKTCVYRAGKKNAGRLLDGRTWDGEAE